MPSGEPTGEIPTRRMPDQSHALEIQRIAYGQGAEKIGCVSEIAVRPRPSASGMTHPAVFNAPTGDAAARENLGHRAHVGKTAPGGAELERSQTEHYLRKGGAGSFRRVLGSAQFTGWRQVVGRAGLLGETPAAGLVTDERIGACCD